ncbi:thioredoxin family protein [Humibacter albus]|uniref:thioredoxin family protein n=1 Tax=Humibacter albus TaxID=427754 RepID=UPI0003B5F11C|nr:thioredoxin family protein [Humibacter albus]
MIIADETTFRAVVESAPKPVLVYFWVTWCGPCRVLGPLLERMEADSGAFTIVKVNADDSPALAAEFGVLAVPTMKLLAGGEVVRTIVGAKPRAALEAELAPALTA